MNILIIRPGAIGDALLTFSILKALREKYSNPHLTFVSNANVLPLAVAFGLAEEVSDYGHVQWGELFSTTGIQAPAMREQLLRTDLAICWLRDSDGLVERNLRKAGVGQVVVAPGRPTEDMHVVEYLAQTVGVSTFLEVKQYDPVRTGVIHHAPACLVEQPTGRDESRPYDPFLPSRMEILHNAPIAIHPGSGGAHKCWPAHSFAAVIEQLWNPHRPNRHSHSVLLLAGPADQERLHDILNSIGYPPEPAMLRTLVDAPLLEVAQQLQQCKCYLGNDSGITHLAAMLGVPTVALFGPSNPAIWRPPGPSVCVIREQPLEQLDSWVVIDAIEAFVSL